MVLFGTWYRCLFWLFFAYFVIKFNWTVFDRSSAMHCRVFLQVVVDCLENKQIFVHSYYPFYNSVLHPALGNSFLSLTHPTEWTTLLTVQVVDILGHLVLILQGLPSAANPCNIKERQKLLQPSRFCTFALWIQNVVGTALKIYFKGTFICKCWDVYVMFCETPVVLTGKFVIISKNSTWGSCAC